MTDMTVKQAGAIVAALYKQATGQTVPAPLDLSGYISIATTTAQYGWDMLYRALSQMWGRTIIAIRPYRGAYLDMDFDTDAWSNAERKVSYASRIPGDNAAYAYPVAYDATEDPATGDGLSVDQWKINKDKPVQTVFYGRSTYSYTRTRFLDQLESAFYTPADLLRFNAGAVQSLDNDREGWREAQRRGMLVNAIGALYDDDNVLPSGRVVHLLTEYNEATGQELDAEAVRLPANYAPFMRWVYGRMGEIKDRFRENNILYTTQLTALTDAGYCVLRHTPDAMLRIKVTSKELHHLRASVLSTTYNADYLSLDGVEAVPYWQNPDAPDEIQVKPVYMGADGQETQGDETTVTDIFGVMYDRDFVGCTTVRSKMTSSPLNASGEYYNDFYKEIVKTRFDMSEKAVLLLLD